MTNNQQTTFEKDLQYYKFCFYGFFKNLKFFEPFLLLFFVESGINYVQIGTLYAFRELAINFLEIPTGVLSDVFGRKITLIFSFFSYILSFLVFFFFNQFYVLFIGMLFFSFGDAFRSGTHKAMIFKYLELKGWSNHKIDYYGHTRSFSQIGSALSALIAAGIVFLSGNYRIIFLFSIVPYLLDMLLIFSYPKILDGNKSSFHFESIKNSFKSVLKEFFYSFKNWEMFKSLLNSSIYSGYYKAVKDYLQPVLKTFALSIPIFLSLHGKERESIVIGVVYFIIYFISVFSARNSGAFSKIFSSSSRALNFTLSIGFVFGIVSGLLYDYKFFILSIIFYMLIYVTENLRKPIGIAYISSVMKGDILVTTLSASSQLKSLTAAGLAFSLGLLANFFGPGKAILIISAVLLISSPIFFLRGKD